MSDKTKAELKEQIKIMNHNYQTIKEMHDRGYRYSVSEIEKLKQELETTRKALDKSEHCCTEWEKQALDYKAENIKLSKVLDYAIGVLHCIKEQCLDYAADYMDLADKALEQIESITKGGKDE